MSWASGTAAAQAAEGCQWDDAGRIGRSLRRLGPVTTRERLPIDAKPEGDLHGDH